MYLAIKPRKSCALAWLEAATIVNAEPKHQSYNVIIDVSQPQIQSPIDGGIINSVNEFLYSKGVLPLQSVSNTIFPDALYRRHGAPRFIEIFNKDLLPKLRKTDRWTGYYFERMTAYQKHDGSKLDQLSEMVQRIRDDRNKSLNKFEISIFDPERDIDNSPYGGQCLSFLSFKLLPGQTKKLALTAVYRNHYYIEKLLGNMIGLTRLMDFIAKESDISPGPLTIVSTHAYVDAPKKCKRNEINFLLDKCNDLIENSP